MSAYRGDHPRSARAAPLAARYDALLFDLDGVVYRGDQPVPGAAEALNAVRRLGSRPLFLTNNSSRTAEQVAAKLQSLGVLADPGEILTSGLATAAMLKREGWEGRTAFVIGERGVREALQAAGIELVDGEPPAADLVVVGWDRGADYAKLRTASLLVERGARLVATNPDVSYPAPDGLWPGAGALVAVIIATTGATPTVVGKPARPLFQAAAEQTGAQHPLVIGDRLDTDIQGAVAMGWDSLLVLTGAAGPADLLRTTVLPTYVRPDLGGLLRPGVRGAARSAKPHDVEQIRGLLAASGLIADDVAARVEATVVITEEPPAASSPNGGPVLATASLEPVDRRRSILRSVAVREDLRGQGLGMLAVAAAVTEGRRRHPEVVQVWLFTETAEPFFARMGFRRAEGDALPEPVAGAMLSAGCRSSAAAMWIDL